ncbi:MAG: cytochrome c [Thermodesulfobacteriota bacterium]
MDKKFIYAAALLVFSFTVVISGYSAALADVKENYRFYCSQCHGLEGKGDGPNATKSQPVSPRNHTDPKEMGKLTDEDIINVITGGGKATSKSTMMPPFGKTLTEKEIAELKDHLRGLCKCKGP